MNCSCNCYTIYRGTTPTLKFKFPFKKVELLELILTFWQDDKIILEKRMNDDGVCVKMPLLKLILTQGETLLFEADEIALMQIKIKSKTGIVGASDLMRFDVKEIFHKGVI